MEIYGDEDLADLPENHRFAIPDGCHWDDIRSVTQNVGATVLKAMRAIESANPDTLPGVFGDGDWGNKNLLPDSTLADLIEHFSSKTLSIANLPEDELGNGYEYLIKKFADDSGHTAQEFYTNRTLVHLMTLMLEPQPGESVYDPTCGTGGMLISAAAEVKRQGKEWRNLRLYGQELNYGTSAIARMNLFLHGIADGHIAHGDTLDPARVPRRQGTAADLRRRPRQSAVLDQGVEPCGLREGPLRPQHVGRPAAGPRRLRLLPAHRQEPRPEDRPCRDPLPARRSLPPRRGGTARGAREVRSRRVRPRPRRRACSTTRRWKRSSSSFELDKPPSARARCCSSTPSTKSPASRRSPSSASLTRPRSSMPTATLRTRTDSRRSQHSARSPKGLQPGNPALRRRR